MPAKETGIIFDVAAVSAILRGAQTKALVPVQGVMGSMLYTKKPTKTLSGQSVHVMDAGAAGLCPWGRPGDLVYAREKWGYCIHALAAHSEEDGPFLYAADGDMQRTLNGWRSPVTMRKAIARLWVKVVSIGAHKIEEVALPDILAAGYGSYEAYRDAMQPHWARGRWVWCIEFEIAPR